MGKHVEMLKNFSLLDMLLYEGISWYLLGIGSCVGLPFWGGTLHLFFWGEIGKALQ